VPLSGFQANAGQTVLGGVELMAAQLNQDGGLLGRRVKVVGLDDESDSDVALAVAADIQAAVERGEPVLGVVGHLNSGQTLAAMPIYQSLPLIVITPTASEVSLTQKGYDNFFRINANDAVQAEIDSRFMVETLGAERIAIVHNDTEYGRGLRDQIRRELDERGAQIAVTIEVEEGQTNYVTEIARLEEAQPDAIFYGGYEIEAPYLRLALIEGGLDQPLLASDGTFLTATIDEAEGTAEGMYISAFAPSPEVAADPAWIKAYQEVEHRNPDTYSINGYSALRVLAEAVRQADSFERAQVINALHQLELTTMVGPVAYDDQGDLESPQIYIYQVRDGAFVQVYPE
jgi:branched-chain amino acid transport system substrate-binding protein